MLLKLQHKAISIWNGIMKYKVLKDFATENGVLYADEIVRQWDALTLANKVRVKDGMGRIWNVPSKLLKELGKDD